MAKNNRYNPKKKNPKKNIPKKKNPKKKIPHTNHPKRLLKRTTEQILDGLNGLQPKQFERAQHVAAKQEKTVTELVTLRLALGQDASGAILAPASTRLLGKHGNEVTKVKTEPATENEVANPPSSVLTRGAQNVSKEALGASHNSQGKTEVMKKPPKKQKIHHAEPKTLPPDNVDLRLQPVDQHLPNYMTLQLRQSATWSRPKCPTNASAEVITTLGQIL